MMTILDDIQAQKQLDPEDLYGSITALPQQCRHAWEDTKDFQVPPDYKSINKIIMTGMGGSGLGARIIESVYGDEIKYPLVRINDYDLPIWADKKTLVICSSFSGTTEETISTAKQAQAKGCKWMSISTGEALHQLAEKYQVPVYKIRPTYNPSKQPRMAIGYSVIGQLVMASRAGLFKLAQTDLDILIKAMNQVIKKNQFSVPAKGNPAKKIAQVFYQKQVFFISARHLTGAVHTFKNQMNENAKNISSRYDIPELNHHLMEGLRFPKANQKDLIFFFAESRLYSPKIQKRFKITQEVVKKNHLPLVTWQAQSRTELAQAFELIQFGSLVNFYLAMLNQINPAPVPWVDYFKTKLGQPLGQWK